jgi:hypothetical protein
MLKRIFKYFSFIPLLYLIAIYGLFIYISIIRGSAPFYGDEIPIPDSVKWLFIFCFYTFDYIFIIGIFNIVTYVILFFKREIKFKDYILHLGIISTIYFFIEAFIDIFSIQMWLFD